MKFTSNPFEPKLNTIFQGGRRDALIFMRYLKLNFQNHQSGAGEGSNHFALASFGGRTANHFVERIPAPCLPF